MTSLDGSIIVYILKPAPPPQFGPAIALRTDLTHITTELWEIPVCRWRINFTYDYIALLSGVSVFSRLIAGAM